jgi:hypothetical protein
MATNRPLSYHHYYQILSKFRSKSSDSLLAIHRKNELPKQVIKPTKMKKSQTILSNFESKSPTLRRRFSFFRLKRSSTSNVEALQEIIDQLKNDLQTKTDELESMREHQPVNQSIEQAMQLQTILNAKLEEMLKENDLLKKNIEELESFAQQQKSKSKREKKFSFYR